MTRLAERYGWRGLWLMVMGATWVAFGIGVLLAPADPSPWVLHQMIDPQPRAVAWVLTGLFAIWVGTRGPDRDDSLGYVALYIMPAVRLASFSVSWIVYALTTATHQIDASVHVIGNRDGWYAALIWLLVHTMLSVNARRPNPNPGLLPAPPTATEAA